MSDTSSNQMWGGRFASGPDAIMEAINASTDFRLWVRDQYDALDDAITALIRAFLDQAQSGYDWVMPGFTHLQTAQPVTWGHHMMAYVEMLGRDLSRLRDARARMNECPLGSAALAGTSFNIDRHMTAAELGFARPTSNSLDAVSDRDFALEFLSSLCRRIGYLVLGAIPLCVLVRSLFDRLLHHAAKEKPRCG